MARYRGSGGDLWVDQSSGGSGSASPLRYVSKWSGDFSTSTIEVTAFGDTTQTFLPSLPNAKISFSGFADDTATTGPHVVFGAPDTSPQASTRTLAIVFGNSKTWTSEGYLVSYSVQGVVNQLTKFDAVLQQNSGAWS
jgi:hypothetical protein